MKTKPKAKALPNQFGLSQDGEKESTRIYRLPFTFKSLKITAFHWLFKSTPYFFRNTGAYQNWLTSRNQPDLTDFDIKLKNLTQDQNKEFSSELSSKLAFQKNGDPQVTIVIPITTEIEYTLTCLQSIKKCNDITPYEIIVIGAFSDENIAESLMQIEGIKLINNMKKADFSNSCNQATLNAKGKYLLFLHNNTQVKDGFVDFLFNTFQKRPDAGLIGSKLLFLDGHLKEAGGIIGHNVTLFQYGCDDNPELPEYCYLRNVDYCSTDCFMIAKELFEKIGGFDTQFIPKGYECIDLAFSVKEAGYAVLYQPFSVVVLLQSFISCMQVNKHLEPLRSGARKKLFNKWKKLKTEYKSEDTNWLQKDRFAQRRALVLDVNTPRPDRDSGSIDTLQYIKMLQALNFKVVFCPHDMNHDSHYTKSLQKLGVECLYQPYIESLQHHLQKYGNYYDLVLLQRAHQTAENISDVKLMCSNAKLVFNTVDLHYLREQRQAEIEQSSLLSAQAEETKSLEIGLMKKCHATIVINEVEHFLLKEELPDIHLYTIPYIREVLSSVPSYSKRQDIVFLGGFLFEPNVDAVLYFLENTWPLIHEKLPEVRFLIIGSNMPEKIKKLASIPGVDPLGFVENLTPILNRCRLSIAPLRFGAGIKGKIGTSLTHGVPCIATPVAAEGMGVRHKVNIMVGEDPQSFANSLIEAYQNEKLWNSLSENGIELFEKNYSFSSGLERFSKLVNDIM